MKLYRLLITYSLEIYLSEIETPDQKFNSQIDVTDLGRDRNFIPVIQVVFT